VAENSFRASFIDETEKKKLLGELASYFEAPA
jgi:adenosine deaminase